VGGGNTIIVKPGTYLGPVTVSGAQAGTASSPTIIKSETKWMAVLVGSGDHGVYTGTGANWVVLDGFEVMGARYDGIAISGDYSTVRNCWVHNNARMGISMHGRTGGVIENNLVEFNGTHVQFHHGVYADGVGLVVRGNVIRHNAGFGLHFYPSMKGGVITNNLVYGQARQSGIIVVCPTGGGGNVVANNTVADNATAITIWGGKGEVVVNNILRVAGDPLVFDSATTSVLADYNVCSVRSSHQGAHDRIADPNFVDAKCGAYWLAAGSPAIGAAARAYMPAADFWGRALPASGAVDAGCFPYLSPLCSTTARSTWYSGWAYSYGPVDGARMPDLWVLPTGS
jgi:parallel beta-helix repeat protein